MKYINEFIRRQDRLLAENKAIALLRSGEYGVLSLQTITGSGYGIPINFAWDGQSSIYLHCAPKGKKLDCIESHPNVSFCIVGKTNIVPHKFTTGYESIILHGEAHIKLSSDERRKALNLILDKYSPNDKELGIKYMEKSFHRTEIIRLDINEWSGKCKRI